MKRTQEKNTKRFGRGYGFYILLLLLSIVVSVIVYIRIGGAAAGNCLLWGIVSVTMLSLLVTSAFSIAEEGRARETRLSVPSVSHAEGKN